MVTNQEHFIKTKRILLSLVAIFFPWAIIFADDNPLGGFAAMIMQVTLIGWIPAVMWAWNIVHRQPEPPIVDASAPAEPVPTPMKSKPPKVPK